MKSAFVLPSCNYNITLEEKDLKELLDKRCITLVLSRTPCSTSRALWNSEIEKMEFFDKKEIANDLIFNLDSPVLDLPEGPWNVQFLTIGIPNKE